MWNGNQGYQVSTGETVKSNSVPENSGNQAVSLRLAGEQLDNPKTIGMYQGSTLSLKQVDLPSVQCLMEKDRKEMYGIANCYLSLALGLQHAYLSSILTTLTESIILYTFIYLTASSKPFMSANKCF